MTILDTLEYENAVPTNNIYFDEGYMMKEGELWCNSCNKFTSICCKLKEYNSCISNYYPCTIMKIVHGNKEYLGSPIVKNTKEFYTFCKALDVKLYKYCSHCKQYKLDDWILDINNENDN